MKGRLVTLTILLAAGLCLAQLTTAKELKPPSADELAMIQKAAPDKATATPKAPRTILVFNRCEGFVHSSIPYVAQAIESMGQKTGAFNVEQSTDMKAFKPENLKRFDAIVLNSTTKLKFEDDALKQSLLDFVKSGKGLVGIHAATDNFYDWPEAAEMMGGLFNGHPWRSNGTWVFKIEDPTNPLMAAFGGKGFSLSDEIYRIRYPFSRKKLRVLMSLDLTNPQNLTPEDLNKPDIYDAPVCWIRDYGKGRVFYSSLGHNKELSWNPMILRHYLDGIQWAIGDLQADATPLYVDWSYFEYSLDAMKDYEYGKNQRALNAVGQAVRDGCGVKNIEQRLEKDLIGFLKGDATLPAKQFVCRQLRLIGSEACIPVLAGMLTNPDTSDMARYAIQGIESPAVDDALLSALNNSSGNTKIGIINSLGARATAKAAGPLGNLVYNADPAIAQAALSALGHIANDDAREIFSKAIDKTQGDLRLKACNGYLLCADRLAKKGDKKQAEKMYEQMTEPSQPKVIRMAAIKGLISNHPDPGSVILDVLKQNDTDTQSVALGMLGQLPSVSNLKAIAQLLPQLAPTTQVQLLTALGNRGDLSVRDEVTAAANSDVLAVRMAALEALANLGDDQAVILLAKAAAAATSMAERDIARRSLYSIRSPKADDIIIANIPTADKKVKKELILSVSNRNIVSAVDVLFKAVADADKSTRIDIYRSLKKVARPEHIPQLIDILKTESSSSARKEAEYALRDACQHIRPKSTQVDPIIQAWQQAPADATDYRCSLINVLGYIERDEGLDTVLAAAKDSDQEVKKTALMVLSEWPNTKPTEVLKNAATAKWNSDRFKIPAALGYVRMIRINKELTAEQKVDLYREALSLFEYPSVRKKILSSLSQTGTISAMKIAAEYLKNDDLKLEAEATIKTIAEEQLKNLPPQAVQTILDALQVQK